MLEKELMLDYLYTKDGNISPIRIQKFAYFSFALWFSQENFSSYSDENCLFNSNFQAWKYGPVDIDLYKMNKNFNNKKSNYDSINADIVKFLDEVWEYAYKYTDFELVRKSHKDISWKKNHCKNDFYHMNSIPACEIWKEYTKKEWIRG